MFIPTTKSGLSTLKSCHIAVFLRSFFLTMSNGWLSSQDHKVFMIKTESLTAKIMSGKIFSVVKENVFFLVHQTGLPFSKNRLRKNKIFMANDQKMGPPTVKMMSTFSVIKENVHFFLCIKWAASFKYEVDKKIPF